MFPESGRTKKLIVAFHFQSANRAAWKCDECRASGLERKRRCGWLAGAGDDNGRPVWAGRGVAITTCPVSYISAASLSWLEEFVVWRTLGGLDLSRLSARSSEAFSILSAEIAKGVNRGD